MYIVFNDQVIMVPDRQVREACELLDILQTPSETVTYPEKLGWSDKLRVLAELFLGHWCMPMRRKSRVTTPVTVEEPPATN